MAIAFLPSATVGKAVKVSCDRTALGSSATMSCDQAVALAARIAATMSKNPMLQVAITKPSATPDLIQVTFWVKAEEGTGNTAFTSTVDPANKTVTFPAEDSSAVFPNAS